MQWHAESTDSWPTGRKSRWKCESNLFRTYLADLGEYLTKHVGFCISDTIVAHLLWVDDLVLISDSEQGLQKQLNGLQKFCSKNLMIINELKTKVLVFCSQLKANVYFNGKHIEQVENYKYLGNILTTISSPKIMIT